MFNVLIQAKVCIHSQENQLLDQLQVFLFLYFAFIFFNHYYSGLVSYLIQSPALHTSDLRNSLSIYLLYNISIALNLSDELYINIVNDFGTSSNSRRARTRSRMEDPDDAMSGVGGIRSRSGSRCGSRVGSRATSIDRVSARTPTLPKGSV